jgi:hypothetical protein
MVAWPRSNHRAEPFYLEYHCGEKAFVRNTLLDDSPESSAQNKFR